jgi:hypothetical protein
VGAWRLDTRSGRLRIVDAVTPSAPVVAPELRKVQARIDATLPDMTNRIDAPVNAQVPMLLVFSYSDRDPGRFYLYDRSSEKLVAIGRRRPDVDPQKMARRERVDSYWVTTPADGKQGARPTVIVTGTRDVAKEWDAPTQFLASRGYTVVETPAGPEEAARWAVAKGNAEPGGIVHVALPAGDEKDYVSPLEFWTGVAKKLSQ